MRPRCLEWAGQRISALWLQESLEQIQSCIQSPQLLQITPRCCCLPYVTITPCICSGLGPLFIVFCSVRFLACLLHIFLPSLFMNTNYMNIDSVNTTLLSLLLNSFDSISRYPRIRPMFMIMNIFGGSHFEGWRHFRRYTWLTDITVVSCDRE